nr:SMP-30/gluconolactonase/LRE family protein [Paracoccaceae bacterium]
ATFADTTTRQVMRTRLGRDGWPEGEAEVFLDLRAEGLNPDGAVFDAGGTLWLAEWGAARVSAYGPDGRRLGTVAFPAQHTSCPAFGGADLATLFCTTARQGVSTADLARFPLTGQTFAAPGNARGLPEHRVIL